MRRLLLLFGTLFAAAALSGATAAETMEQFLKRGRAELCAEGFYQEQYDKTVPRAAGGDPVAQMALGVYYQYGNCNEPDLQQAVIWYRRAADANHIPAMITLAEIYTVSLKDDKQAFAWYLRAAEIGDADAAIEVADRYDSGRGVAANIAIAKTWYGRAAQQGHPVGFWGLAASFGRPIEGPEPPRNRFLAYVYALLTLKYSDENSKKFRLPPPIKEGNVEFLRSQTPPEQRQEAEATAAAWKLGMPLPQ